jgi:predicted thioredoxin/glutaredoxin
VIEVVIHHTCASSHKLYSALKGKPIKWTPATISHLRAMALGIPAVYADGRLVLVDPVKPEDVEALLAGRNEGGLGVEEAVENFAAGVLYNQSLLSLALLHKSFKPLLDRELVEVLTRARYRGRLEAAGEAARAIAERDAELFAENYERMVKAAAYGLVRELYWLGLRPGDVDEKYAALWLLAKATVGRIGLQFPRPGVDKRVAADLAAVLRERGDSYYARIEEEQRAIASDADFMSLFHGVE